MITAHGVVQPCAQSGAMAEFHAAAGAAAGLLGSLTMAMAWLVSAWLGAHSSHSLYPLGTAAAMTGVILLPAIVLGRWRRYSHAGD